MICILSAAPAPCGVEPRCGWQRDHRRCVSVGDVEGANEPRASCRRQQVTELSGRYGAGRKRCGSRSSASCTVGLDAQTLPTLVTAMSRQAPEPQNRSEICQLGRTRGRRLASRAYDPRCPGAILGRRSGQQHRRGFNPRGRVPNDPHVVAPFSPVIAPAVASLTRTSCARGPAPPGPHLLWRALLLHRAEIIYNTIRHLTLS